MTSTLTTTPRRAGHVVDPVERTVSAAHAFRDRETRHFTLLSQTELARELRLRATVEDTIPDLVREQVWSLAGEKGGFVTPLIPAVPMHGVVMPASHETSRGEVAAMTPFGTAAVESSLTLESTDEPAKRLAVFATIERGALEDAGAVREVVETLLRSDCLRVLDNEVLNGDGTGEHFDGIFSVDGPPGASAIAEQVKGATSSATAVYRALMTVRGNGNVRPVDIVAGSAALQAVFDSTDFDTRLAAMREVGLRSFVCSGLVPAQTALVGSFGEGARLMVRSDLEATLSNAHATFFLDGKVALLVEGRFTFRVLRSSAFVKATGLV